MLPCVILPLSDIYLSMGLLCEARFALEISLVDVDRGVRM
jgi:hypothetical protein